MNNDTGTPSSGTAENTAAPRPLAAENTQPQMPAKRSRARRTCVFCLGSILLVVVGLALFFGAMFYFTAPSREEAVELIESDIIPALKTLDSAKLQAIGTTNLQESLQSTTTLRMLETAKEKIGPLESVDWSQVRWNIHYGGDGMLYRWSSPAVFQKDSTGTLSLVLRRVEGQWKLHTFTINSPNLFL